MRIKQLELIGFKSFVHRTVVDFPCGITAIVGPNGCGKSNVVDAIRWVLGEQSPKHLRGESMEDVIFNGNERVAPTGMAQVSLTFENDPAERRPSTDLDLDVSTIPAHFRDLTEIMVTRRYFRSGESEYFINKTPCRLKDITELFLGTGIGSKAYAIIEQGRVEQLISAKPEDRRLFIEEAAGTTLYRSRKLAAERKMERSRENLLRVSDILHEIERQVQYLHRMAKKAEQYRALQDEIRELDLGLGAAQWRTLTTALGVLEAERGGFREQERHAQARLVQLESERVAKVAAQATAEHTLARKREAAAVLEAECRSLQQRLGLLRQELGERARRIARLRADAEAQAGYREEVHRAIQQQEEERNRHAQLALFDDSELAQKETQFAAARAQVVTASREVEATKDAVIALLAREAECRNTLAVLVRQREDAQRRLQKLAVEQADAIERLSALEATLASRHAEVDELRERLRAAEGEKEQRAQRIRCLAEERRGSERTVLETQNVLLQLRSRLESLQDIQRNYEGYHRGVRSILLGEQRAGGVLGVVADVLAVPEPYERAVAAALGERLQYVIVRQEDDGIGAVQTLRHEESGRGSFIPLSPRTIRLNGNGARSLNGNTRRLLDLVNVEEPYQQVAETLLGEVVLVPDLQSGLALWRKNGVHVTMVTPDGDVIDATGVITGGSERPVEEEIVSRRRLAHDLIVEVAASEERLRNARMRFERSQHELAEEEGLLKSLDLSAHSLTLELVAKEKDIERLALERPRWLDRIEVTRFESANMDAEEAERSAAIEKIEGELADAAAQRAAVEVTLRLAQESSALAASSVDQLSGELTNLKVRLAERRQRQDAAASAVSRLLRQRDEFAGRAAAIAAELEQTVQEHAHLGAGVQEAESQHGAQQSQRELLDAEIHAAGAALDTASAAVTALDRDLHDGRTEMDAIRSRGAQCEIALAEKRLRVEQLTQNIREKYGEDLTEQSPVVADDAEEQAIARLDALRLRLSRFGEVNVGAIDELQELAQRADFLRTQRADLERSLADLERTIQRLNRASRTRFAETFASVNEKFQSVLPRLFRGGEARLVLTDEHNLLESGVEIIVRPPGKRLDTVTLLSGGEKALVAVSLIFSLFLINPTPFCFLDEVDAPLDDANIGRFANLVRETSEHSQFIVITHNKRTMQAADVLYGVTMEDPGVSKIISVAMH
ncbi:MAG: chromosome segregation protein SMC [Candidatus Binatia bacterium]